MNIKVEQEWVGPAAPAGQWVWAARAPELACTGATQASAVANLIRELEGLLDEARIKHRAMDEAERPRSKAQRIAEAIHKRTVIGGMDLGRALQEVKEEFEGPDRDPRPIGPGEAVVATPPEAG